MKYALLLMLVAAQERTVVVDEVPAEYLGALSRALRDEDWPRVVQLYARGVARHGDKLVQDGRRWIPLREHLESLAAKLPAAFVEEYRRVNSGLEREIRAARDKQDVAAMEALSDRAAFMSDALLDEIGNRHFEQGRAGAAFRAWWRLLRMHPSAVTAAKLARAAVVMRDDVALASVLKAAATIAGTIVVDGDSVALETYLAGLTCGLTPLPARTMPSPDRPTVAIVARNEIVRGTLPLFGVIDGDYPFDPTVGRVGDRTVVVLANGRRITVVDAANRKILWQHPEGDVPLRKFPPRHTKWPATLSLIEPTVADGRVYAAAYSASQPNPPRGTYEGCQELVCLDAQTGRLYWSASAPFDAPEWAFTGAPLVVDDLVIVSVTTSPLRDVECHLAAFERATGRLRWSRFVASANVKADTICPRPAATADDGVIYVTTNVGAVAAVEASTGRMLWLAPYVRGPLVRWESAPVVHRGILYCLPQDSAALVSVELRNGAPWTLPTAVAWPTMARLVGTIGDWLVVQGRESVVINLVARERFVLGRVYGLPRSDGTKCGRGTIDGETLYLPARDDGVAALSVYHGIDSFRNVFRGPCREAGNVAVAGECVIMTAKDAIFTTSAGELRREFNPRLVQSPPDPAAWLAYAELSDDAGAFAIFADAARGDPRFEEKMKQLEAAGKIRR